MPQTDSVDKIVQVYFRSVTRKSFVYKGVTYAPTTLHVSPLLTRGFNCPSHCGGCCPRFSLDYLPSEKKPQNTSPRMINFDSRQVEVFSDLQTDHQNHHCRNLNMTDGRCGIYQVRPFSCDFELIRFFQYDDRNRLSQQLFGRGWQFLRIDNERGALCTMTPADPNTIKESVRKLNRLQIWADHFGITTWVPTIIDWILSDPSKTLKLTV